MADGFTAHIETIDHTGSTNSDLMERAANGVPEGFWLRAKSQGAGRGRSAREWVSPIGNIYTSTIVRLRPDDPPATDLAFVAAVALFDSINHFLDDREVMIKWPNDILVNGAKICGILLERTDDAIIMGTGVNLSHSPQNIERAVTSIAELEGYAPNADDFMILLAENFAHWLNIWRTDGFSVVRKYWLANAHRIGQKIAHREYVGTFDGLNKDGACLLRTDDGAIIAVNAGDIFLLE